MSGEFDIIQDQIQQLSQPRRRYPCPRPLIFLHLPKAGGSTLQEVIVRNYACGFGFRFTGDLDQLQAFKALPAEMRAKFDLVHGHVHFGIHEWVPDPALYMTMLRDPVDRLVSYYYFVKAHPEHYLYPKVFGGGMSLKEYALRRACIEVDNDQVRWLCARPHRAVPIGKVTREMLEEAKWNLANSITVLGLVERFDDSLRCMGAAFGWRDLSYPERKNVTPDRPPLTEVPQDAIDAIREVNRFDVELYELATALFEEQMLRLKVPGGTVVGARKEARPKAAVPA